MRKFLLALSSAVILISSCAIESTSPYEDNASPVIRELNVSPADSLVVGDTLYFSCEATDTESDSLSYIWTAEEGYFVEDSVNIDTVTSRFATWVAPQVTGHVQVKLAVSDRWHCVEQDVNVKVLPVGALNHPPVIENISRSADSVNVSGVVSLYANVSDEDDPVSALDFTWWSRGGILQNANGRYAEWFNADTGGYYIGVTVRDSFSEATDSVRIMVLEDGDFNEAPVINELVVETNEPSVGDTVSVSCIASDPDNDSLSYNWTSWTGEFIGSGSNVKWIAPDEARICTLDVAVSDEQFTTWGQVMLDVLPRVEILYTTDFSTDEVTGNWELDGLLYGLGESLGFNDIGWDSTGQRMSVIARSSYGTFGFKFNQQTFGEAKISIDLAASSTQFGTIGLVPKFIDTGNYILIAMNFTQSRWDIITCVDSITTYKAGDWLAQGTLIPNTPYRIVYTQSGREASVEMLGREVWRGEVASAFEPEAYAGVAVYGLQDSGPAYFDNFSVTNP